MGFVEQDDGSQAVAGGVFESVLQLAHQSGENTGGREAAGDGDFLAQVTLGGAGHLDVMELEASMRHQLPFEWILDEAMRTLDNIPVALSQWRLCRSPKPQRGAKEDGLLRRAIGDRHSSGGPLFWVWR